ncbi:nucleotidyltransferase domain-containing protein [Desulforegula conservatrix]|uniref:nucleotidyltransferase domain-containing protein n=1 Tax=Desulforegula conservatrix TaxID=153026 RepID=UPI00040EA954|nr:nucleotidyltransferase [Desulforegula conservatrix]
MKKQFQEFAENIRLTDQQENDAFTKYDGVCDKLHKYYYATNYDGKTKFLFGSYRTKTNVRPLSDNQDVDVIFKIPEAVFNKFKGYKNNGPSALLQDIRNALKEKYTTTDEIKAWGKVVLVKFTNNRHNVEVLPAYENEDGTFTIPNSENGGSWDKFDPRKQMDAFYDSNQKTNGLTANLARMIKTWVRNTQSLNYKSYNILEDIISFLKKEFKAGADFSEYPVVIKNYLEFINNSCEESIKTHVETALKRSVKAIEYMDSEKPKEASEEWRKIFGYNDKSLFPLVTENPEKRSMARTFLTPSAPYGNL